MQDGWIKLYRAMVDWEWYDDKNVKILFLHLLLTVNHKPGNWRGHTILPGERITSLEKLAKEAGLSVREIRTSIEKLESTGELTRKATNKFTHISLSKWGEYQQDEPRATRRQTNGRQTSDMQATTIKECKNEKNEKNIEQEQGEVALRAPTPAQTAIDFFSPEADHAPLIGVLCSKGMQEDVVREELAKFISYWTEPNKSGTKQRWQMQTTFEVRRRLVTWFGNVNKSVGQFNSQQQPKGIKL